MANLCVCGGVVVKIVSYSFEMCPEMHFNEMHELYDRHHKVSPTINSY